ncbi:MAG: hypothetical protein ACYS8L_00230 [Planctomycetota bacterium]|jgi:hypothetical protein
MLTLVVGGGVLVLLAVVVLLVTRRPSMAIGLPAVLFALLVGGVLGYSYYKAGQWSRVEGERVVKTYPLDLKNVGVEVIGEDYLVYVQTERRYLRKKIPLKDTRVRRFGGKGKPSIEVYEKTIVDDEEAGPERPLWYIRIRRGRRTKFSHYVLNLPESEEIRGAPAAR